MHKLTSINNNYFINKINPFKTIDTFNDELLLKVFDFSYNMSFGKQGQHRSHRSGGTNRRKNGEIFINTFQGKLAEYAVHNQLSKSFEIAPPDLSTYELGKWDSYDFEVNSKKISVKSTKHYGNLLLLETKDWTELGEYIPNLDNENSLYDFFILVRLSPDSENIMTRNRLYYNDVVDYDNLKKIILSNIWSYDIPGFITIEDLISIIKNKHILPKKAILNSNTEMDAENYYVQSGDMRNINELSNFLL